MSITGHKAPPVGPERGQRQAGQRRNRRPGESGEDRGLRRSARLFRLFLSEQTDPERFYSGLAQDTMRQIEGYVDLRGRTVLDVGGGPGHFTAAFSGRGASCALVEPDRTELLAGGEAPQSAVLGDGLALPVRAGAVDICFSSNVLEHVPDPLRFIDEMVRVTRPGGLIYVSFTNWYSPWGGHELSPWHYLGAGRAERRYTRRHGRPPKNRPGAGLFPLHIGPTLRALRARTDAEILDALPRYYPPWCRPVLRLRGIREVATWNLLVVMRRGNSQPGGSTVTSGTSDS
jgi:SAM-dependent methyltransferase